MDNLCFDIEGILNEIPENELVEDLSFLRGEKLKLSELKVDLRNFKYLKKLGVYDSFLPSDQKKWHFFNLTERMMLKLTDIFWQYGYSPETIKDIVEVLISDSWLEGIIKKLLLKGADNSLNYSSNSPSFVEYCVLERKLSPNLRAFTNLDAVLIAAFASKNPVSLIVNGKGQWRVFTGFGFSDSLEYGFQESLFRSTFLNISITSIVDSFLDSEAGDSKLLRPIAALKGRYDTLISKGFDYATLRNVEFDNSDIRCELVSVPVDANIAQLKNQYSNQDIIVKVRKSKVSSIQQLIIKTKNK
jgi:hypothetical protein